jgi:hypothetical protein
LIEGNVSCIVVGDRGAGKSKLAAQARGRGETVVFSVSDWETRIRREIVKVKVMGGEKEERTEEYEVEVFPTKPTQLVLDFPDDVSKPIMNKIIYGIRRRIQELKTTIILCNPSQYEKLREMDLFARLPVLHVPKPNLDFLRRLYKDRIGAFGDQPVSPFRPEVVDHLAEVSLTPRDFIQYCNLILTRMWIDELKEPCSLDYVNSMNEMHLVKHVLHIPENIDATLPVVIDELKAQGKAWVRVKDIVDLLSKRGMKVAYDRLGRKLKNYGFERRRTGEGVQYKIA